MLEVIDGRLDMELSFSAPVRDISLPFVRDDEPVPMSFYLHAGRTSFNFFLENIKKEERDMVRYFNPVSYGSFVMVSRMVDLPVMKVLYENISSIPSMIMSAFYTRNGDFIANYRFHNTDTWRVSKLVSVLVSVGKDITVTKMGRSEGIRSRLEEIERRIPLTVVNFGYGEDTRQNYVSEWRGVSDPFGAVSYGADGKGEISRVDFSKCQIGPLFRALLKDQIQPITYFEGHGNGNVRSTIILPSLFTKPFLVRFFNWERDVRELRLEGIDLYSRLKDQL